MSTQYGIHGFDSDRLQNFEVNFWNFSTDDAKIYLITRLINDIWTIFQEDAICHAIRQKKFCLVAIQHFWTQKSSIPFKFWILVQLWVLRAVEKFYSFISIISLTTPIQNFADCDRAGKLCVPYLWLYFMFWSKVVTFDLTIGRGQALNMKILFWPKQAGYECFNEGFQINVERAFEWYVRHGHTTSIAKVRAHKVFGRGRN